MMPVVLICTRFWRSVSEHEAAALNARQFVVWWSEGDLCLTDLKKLRSDKEDIRDLYVDYLSQYRSCLAETEIAKLDSMWCTLDEKWMRITYFIQIVHDIEYARFLRKSAIGSSQSHHDGLSMDMPLHAHAG